MREIEELEDNSWPLAQNKTRQPRPGKVVAIIPSGPGDYQRSQDLSEVMNQCSTINAFNTSSIRALLSTLYTL